MDYPPSPARGRHWPVSASAPPAPPRHPCPPSTIHPGRPPAPARTCRAAPPLPAANLPLSCLPPPYTCPAATSPRPAGPPDLHPVLVRVFPPAAFQPARHGLLSGPPPCWPR